MGRRSAVVYAGRGRTDRLCAEAVAEVLERSAWGFDVQMVGPAQFRRSGASILGGADLYAQPGGGTLERAYRRLRRSRPLVRSYVASGGRYLGLCLGGYLAGATPGFDLLPGDTDRYIDLEGATVGTDEEAIIPVLWRGARRELYFQDGPHFALDDDAQAEVLARYTNGAVAALVTSFGHGRVGVVGPHPEATSDWFDDLGPTTAAAGCSDLADDLVDALMRS